MEGKAQSRRNSLKHGLSARKLLLTEAKQELFARQLALHSSYWSPRTLQEVELVTGMARASRRQDRAEAMLLELLDRETLPVAFEETYRKLETHLSRIAGERLRTVRQLRSPMEGGSPDRSPDPRATPTSRSLHSK